MTLKTTWANGDQFQASDMNDVATAVNSNYSKPGTGIPATDLESAVQTSLAKADSAVQAVSSTSISDSTSTGRGLITALDASAARTAIGVAYGNSAGTVCQGNDARLTPSSTSLSDAKVTGKALITTTDASSARTTLGVAYGTTAGTVIQGAGALGTPSGGTLTNCTGLPVAGITASTATALGVGSVELGHATDTSITRSSAGVIAVEGVTVPLNAITNTHTALQVELGHATDTTLTRSSAGVLAVEGVVVDTVSAANTLTNKTLTNPTITSYVESVVAIGTVSSANTIALTSGTVQTATLTASTACTFTMPTATAGKSFVLLLKQAAATGNGTAAFTGVKWGSAGAPTITATAGKMDILTFISDGASWYGSVAQGFTP